MNISELVTQYIPCKRCSGSKFIHVPRDPETPHHKGKVYYLECR